MDEQDSNNNNAKEHLRMAKEGGKALGAEGRANAMQVRNLLKTKRIPLERSAGDSSKSDPSR